MPALPRPAWRLHGASAAVSGAVAPIARWSEALDGGLAALRRLGGLLGLVVLVGPLAAAPAAEAQVQAQAQAQVQAQVQARLVAALARLDTLAADTLRRTGVPGLAIAVVADGEVVFAQGFGRRQVDRPDPVDADTVFQLASLSKPLVTTVVAALVGDGPLAWDTPVRRYVPELRLGPPAIADAVTLRDLFSHRSGLPDHAGDDLEDIGFGRIAVIERLRFLPLDNRFRASYAYTNLGFTAAAEAAARSTGRSWEEISAERLYRPLGMDRTSSRHADWLAQPNRAVLHRQQGERWQALFDRDADVQSPAGGASASVRDLARWMTLQLADGRFAGQQVVAAEALAETHRPQMVSKAPADPARDHAGLYGLGWGVGYDDQGQVQLSHSGAFFLGAATTVVLLPAQKIGIVVLSNGQPVGAVEALARSFVDLVRTGTIRRDYLPEFGKAFAAMMAQPYPAVVIPQSPQPARPPAAYTGSYANDYVGTAVVRLAGSGVAPGGAAGAGSNLVLELGPARRPFALEHVSGDTFRYQPTGENADGASAVVFAPGPGGRATSVRIDNLNLQGQGTLRRQDP
ncbi:serine hydrolase [Synechococcus sp. CBW1002]|nr:serine hydrolase [Synechococcus sp. CBW1002]